MKLVVLSITLTVAILCQDVLVFATRGHSNDLSRALGELRRRRRRLESGYSPDAELPRQRFGTITHFAPEKRQFHWGPELMKVALPPSGDVDEENRKKKTTKKRSFFREREQKLDDINRKRKRLQILPSRQSDSDFDDTWESEEAEMMKDLAQRRFLNALLGRAQREKATESNQVPAEFDESTEFENLNLDKEDVSALMELLRRQMYASGDGKYYMEGEGVDESDEDESGSDEDELRKRKRFMWQDGVRYSLGDRPSKRVEADDEYDPEVEAWWRNLDPRILAEIEEMEEDSTEMKRKREPDPWYPAFELPDRKRFKGIGSSNDWRNEKKRGSVFRERVNEEGEVKKKSVVKRIPEEMMADRKRIVKKSISKVGSENEKIMNELKTIMADDKSGEMHHRQERGSSPEMEEEDLTSVEDPEVVETRSDEDDEESPLSDYFGYDRKREAKRKRSWDDYIGIDKRRESLPDHTHLVEKVKTKEPDSKTEESEDKNVTTTEASVASPTGSAKKTETTTILPATTSEDVSNENEEEADERDDETDKGAENHKLSNEKMQRYFKSIAAAMTVKKKRASEIQSDGEVNEPLLAMDRKLQAIENLMLDEVLELVEKNDGDEMKNKIINRLDAAHSLEKMREALTEFDNSLDRIHEDQEISDDYDDYEDRKKKIKKQSMSEALRVMAPQNRKRTEENDGNECKIFSEIVLLCQDISKSAGDHRGALVDACSRHIMCYACDYAYKDGPQIPCDLIFMQEGHDICGKDIYCRSASAQMHGILRQRAKVTERASAPVCLSESCVRAYRRR